MSLIRYGHMVDIREAILAKNKKKISNFINIKDYRNIHKNVDNHIRDCIKNIAMYYGKLFDITHINFITNIFDIYINSGLDMDINTLDYNGNNYLHLICDSSRFCDLFCVELFDYFLSKGLNPMATNNNGENGFTLFPFDYDDEYDKKRYKDHIIKLQYYTRYKYRYNILYLSQKPKNEINILSCLPDDVSRYIALFL